MSHPKAIAVKVDDGVVVLTGQILETSCKNSSDEIKRMPGVASVHHELDLHDSPEDMPALQGLA